MISSLYLLVLLAGLVACGIYDWRIQRGHLPGMSPLITLALHLVNVVLWAIRIALAELLLFVLHLLFA